MMRANAETRNLGPPRMADADAQVEVICAFCGGMGKDPFGIMSPLATCQVCSGTGRHTLRQPTAPCPFCQGTGVHPGSRNTCTTCGGVGTVEIPEDAVACPCCGGTGQVAGAKVSSRPSESRKLPPEKRRPPGRRRGHGSRKLNLEH